MVFLSIYSGAWLEKPCELIEVNVEMAEWQAQKYFDTGLWSQAQIRDKDGYLLVDLAADGTYTDLREGTDEPTT